MKRWFPLWIFPVLLAFSIGTVWLRLSMVGMTYTINQTDTEIRSAQQENERLRLEVARLRSPRHLSDLAKKKFKLAPPGSHQVVHIRKLARIPGLDKNKGETL